MSSTADTGPERPLTVLHLLPMLRTGGMERGVVRLAQRHDRRVVSPGICSFMEPDPRLVAELPGDVAVHVMHRRNGNDPAMVWRLTRLLRRLRPDVVHSHSWGSLVEGLVAARLARVRFLVHGEHGTMETRRWNLAVQRFAWSRVDRVLSVSSRLAERLSATAGFPLERVQVIRNGVDLARLQSGDREGARRALGLTNDALVFGTVGRLVPVKDQASLLRAARVVHEAGVQATLLIAGDGPLLGDLQGLARTLGIEDRVRFLGLRNDIEQVLAALDVFALSSTSEGLSNTLVEAMAAGLPVVATRVGGADEIVVEGETGLLVPPSSPEALGSAIASLLAHPSRRAALAQAGRARAAAQFSVESMVAGYEGLYRALATGAATSVRGRLGGPV